jgi:hypothetical protein
VEIVDDRLREVANLVAGVTACDEQLLGGVLAIEQKFSANGPPGLNAERFQFSRLI